MADVLLMLLALMVVFGALSWYDAQDMEDDDNEP